MTVCQCVSIVVNSTKVDICKDNIIVLIAG